MTTLTVYYDNLCVVCSKEITHYQKQSGSEKIRFVDITDKNFKPELEGVDPYLVHKIMHVKNSSGHLLTKIDAFKAIWKHLPKYNWLDRLSDYYPVRKILDYSYETFVVARPYLPRKKINDCSASPYCETHNLKK